MSPYLAKVLMSLFGEPVNQKAIKILFRFLLNAAYSNRDPNELM